MIRAITLALTTCLLAPPALAQDDEGGRMKRGAQMFLEGFMELWRQVGSMLPARDAGPALQSFAQEMGPALSDLMDEVQDWSVYEPPTMLDNGDIILRRKEPLTPDPDSEAEPPVEPRERKGLPPLDGNKIDL